MHTLTTQLPNLYFVYTEDGFYLGTYPLIEHGDVLQVSESLGEVLVDGLLLHIDEVASKRAWIVQIIGRSGYKNNMLLIEKIEERAFQYAGLARRIFHLAFKSPFEFVRSA